MVVISDFELMRELFVKEGDAFAGKHFIKDLFEVFTGGLRIDFGVK